MTTANEKKPLPEKKAIGLNDTLSGKQVAMGLAVGFMTIWFMASRDGSGSSKADNDKATREFMVTNSKWDGTVYAVKDYLMPHLKDPDSYESISWGQVVKKSERELMVQHKFRSKNSFGGYTIEEYIFTFTPEGVVTDATKISM